MIESSTSRVPTSATVWAEQLRVTGVAIRREACLFFALLGAVCLMAAVLLRTPALLSLLEIESPRALDPGMVGFAIWGVAVAALFPYLVWRGERSYESTPMWTLPVDHAAHALVKVAAGWLWLMALLGSVLALVLLATAIGGVPLGADEARTLVMDWAGLRAGRGDAARSVAWTTPWWQWIQPFTAATASYLLLSALILGTRHPGRWLVVLYFASFVPVALMEVTDIGWIESSVGASAWLIGAVDFAEGTRLASGELVRGWSRLPTIGLWLGTASVWVGLGLAAVVATATRRRDHTTW